jgi:NADH-quinone oxidoreductase subunit G
MPALNQQEGTFVNIDKRVVPIYPALSYGGYTLADLYNALESEAPLERTIELTSELGVQFDALENYFTVGGE